MSFRAAFPRLSRALVPLKLVCISHARGVYNGTFAYFYVCAIPSLLPQTWSGSEFPEIIALRIEGISWGIGLGESGEVGASDGATAPT